MTSVPPPRDTVAGLEVEARAAALGGDWPAAARGFSALAALRPETPSHWYNLGLAALRASAVDAAMPHLRRAVLLAPAEPRYLNNLAAGGDERVRAGLIARLLALDPLHARARADRALALLRAEDFGAALGAARRAQVADPALPEAIARSGQARARSGQAEAATRHYRRYLLIDPADAAGARRDLARLGTIDTSQAMSPAFVGGVFDGYAARFDTHLTRRLRYVGPSVLADLLRSIPVQPVARAVDLGCGSGLSGRELRRFAGHLTGVDLSPGMLARARDRKIYDALHEAEIVAWLAQTPSRYGLAMAADVTSYLGDLAPFLGAVVAVLGSGGRLAMTIHEQSEGDFGIIGGETYSHSAGYVGRVARAAGLIIERLERGAMREEKKRPLPTVFLILRKPAGGV